MSELNEFQVSRYISSEEISRAFDYTYEGFLEISSHLAEPSASRSTENLTELYQQQQITIRNMGILAKYQVELEAAALLSDDELDSFFNTTNLQEVQ